MAFEIFYDAQPRRMLKRLDAHVEKRLLDKIERALMRTPLPRNVKAIAQERGAFRLRVGSYRVLYRMNRRTEKIVLFKLDKRSKAYR